MHTVMRKAKNIIYLCPVWEKIIERIRGLVRKKDKNKKTKMLATIEIINVRSSVRIYIYTI